MSIKSAIQIIIFLIILGIIGGVYLKYFDQEKSSKKTGILEKKTPKILDEKSNIIDLSDKGREFLSPSEPENFIIPVSDGQAYKQFGNAVPVNVIREIAL